MIAFLDQTGPNYMTRLHPSLWSKFSQPWQNEFITVARVADGKVVHSCVPILYQTYRAHPTVWPKGEIGYGLKTQTENNF